MEISTNKVKFSSPTHSANLTIDVSNSGITMINMAPTGSNFVGFMSNSSGLYFKGTSSASFDQISGTSGSATSFSPNIALSLAGSNLNVRYNPDILSIDAQNQLTVSNGAIYNSKLANSSTVNIEL